MPAWFQFAIWAGPFQFYIADFVVGCKLVAEMSVVVVAVGVGHTGSAVGAAASY